MHFIYNFKKKLNNASMLKNWYHHSVNSMGEPLVAGDRQEKFWCVFARPVFRCGDVCDSITVT